MGEARIWRVGEHTAYQSPVMRYLCVFGNPIGHSLSPLLHNAILQSYDLPYLYGRCMLEHRSELGTMFDRLQLHGANITLPFKEQAHSIAHSLSPLAQDIGAVNTLIRDESNQLIGYNTDAPGFIASLLLDGYMLGQAEAMCDAMGHNEMRKLAPLLKQEGNDRLESALILGAGGSAKAIACALQECGVHTLVANRSDKHETFFAHRQIPYCTFDKLDSSRCFDIVINATSASIQRDLPLVESSLRPLLAQAKLAYDLMYGASTPFLLLSQKNRTKCKNGADMLILQAISALGLLCAELDDTARIYTLMRSIFPSGSIV